MAMLDDAQAFRTAADWAGAIRRRDVKARDLVDFYLDRIARLNPPINALIHLEADAARAAADAADAALARGAATGALFGVPMTIKESFQWAGTPVTFGFPDLAQNRPPGEAVVVARLKAAGAILMGKTNVPEALADFQSFNAIHGTTNNPFDLARVPGGSSGGSAAALAAGLSALDYGSDIGGSIRNPAHFCGLFGHKPTWGLVPPQGHDVGAALGPVDLAVVGPLARSAHDLELALAATAGPLPGETPFDPAALPRLDRPVGALKVGVWFDHPFCPIAGEVRALLEEVVAALARAGARIDRASRPGFDPDAAHQVYFQLLHSALASRMPDEAFVPLVALAETGDPARAHVALARAQVLRYRDRQKLDEARHSVRAAWRAWFDDHDLLLAPMMPVAAFPHDQGPMGSRTVDVDGTPLPYFNQLFWAGLATLAGLPATIVPAGVTAAGLPVGIQLVGAPWSDFRLIGIARRLEEMGFGFRAPPMPWAATS